MLHEETVLAIDVGTQSVRALVFDGKGTLVDGTQIIYTPAYYSPRPGWAEQDPDYYWDCVVEACQRLKSKGIVAMESLRAVTITTQRGTVVNLDGQGKPLRPAILWLDQRRAKDLPTIGGGWEFLFRLIGLKQTVHYLQAEAEINWIRENEPEIWEQTKHYLLLSGYLTYKLTGQFIDSIGSQVAYIPFDYRKFQWLPSDHWKSRAIPVPTGAMPELIAPGEQMGQLSAQAALLTGLPQGLPVIAAASDKACEVLGSGSRKLHQGCVGYGTTVTIVVNSDKYIEPIPLLPPYPSAIAGTYNLEIQTFRGFWMVSWFKEQFAEKERMEAEMRGIAAEELLEELAAAVPAGSMGLVLQPYWTPGIRYPHPEAKGGIIGFGAAHNKPHVYRAILEGLAFAVREGRERIEKRSKVAISELYICGGGSKSDQMMQITADVFGIPAMRPSVSETSGLGAAILAATGVGLHADLNTAVQEMTSVGETFLPHSANVELYDQLYTDVYQKMYKALRPIYQSIQKITGYPEIPGMD